MDCHTICKTSICQHHPLSEISLWCKISATICSKSVFSWLAEWVKRYFCASYKITLPSMLLWPRNSHHCSDLWPTWLQWMTKPRESRRQEKHKRNLETIVLWSHSFFFFFFPRYAWSIFMLQQIIYDQCISWIIISTCSEGFWHMKTDLYSKQVSHSTFLNVLPLHLFAVFWTIF